MQLFHNGFKQAFRSIWAEAENLDVTDDYFLELFLDEADELYSHLSMHHDIEVCIHNRFNLILDLFTDVSPFYSRPFDPHSRNATSSQSSPATSPNSQQQEHTNKSTAKCTRASRPTTNT